VKGNLNVQWSGLGGLWQVRRPSQLDGVFVHEGGGASRPCLAQCNAVDNKEWGNDLEYKHKSQFVPSSMRTLTCASPSNCMNA